MRYQHISNNPFVSAPMPKNYAEYKTQFDEKQDEVKAAARVAYRPCNSLGGAKGFGAILRAAGVNGLVRIR